MRNWKLVHYLGLIGYALLIPFIPLMLIGLLVRTLLEEWDL